MSPARSPTRALAASSDRNITLVGRVVHWMLHLSALPRGTASLGFTTSPNNNVPIKSARIAMMCRRPNARTSKSSAPTRRLFASLVESLRNRSRPVVWRPPDT